MANRRPPSSQFTADPNAPIESLDPSEARAAKRQGGSQAMVPWIGCPLVPVDEKNPKMVPANADFGVKLEIVGWERAGDVAKARLGSRVHITLITDLDMTPDDVHRQYGHGIYFAQLYSLDPTTGNMAKAWTGLTHTLSPCVFDEPDRDNDPLQPEEDVGSQVWPIAQGDIQRNPLLRAEIARRREELQNQGEGGFEDDPEDDPEERHGGRGRGRGNGGGRDPRFGRMPPMGGRRPMQDDPEWMFDPHTRPTAPCPPGLMWSFGGNPMKWFHAERTAENVAAAAAVAPPAPEKTSFYETTAGAAVLTAAMTVLGGIATKLLEKGPPPPDPVASIAALMAALQPKTDPAAMKQMEIEAEDRRAAANLAAENARIERENARIAAATEAAEKQRKHDAEVAAAQRLHDAKMEADRREAAAREAIAAEDRARQRAVEARNELITLQKLGLDPNAKPQRSEESIRAEMRAEILVKQLEAERDAARASGDVASQIKKAEMVLKAAGIDVNSEASKSMLSEFFGSDAGKTAVIQGFGMLDRIMEMLLNRNQPQGAQSQQPMQAQVGVTLSAEELAKREQLAYETGIRRAREAMEAEQRAALAAQPPPPSLMDWQAVPAPVADQPVAAEPAEQPAPVPEPVAEATAAPVEEQPAPEPAPVTEAPAEASEQPVEAVSEPVAEPVAEPAPEAPPVVAEVPSGVEMPAEPEASEATAEEALGG